MTTRDNGGMTGRYLIINCATGNVVTDMDDEAEAITFHEGCLDESPEHEYILVDRGERAAVCAEIVAKLDTLAVERGVYVHKADDVFISITEAHALVREVANG